MFRAFSGGECLVADPCRGRRAVRGSVDQGALVECEPDLNRVIPSVSGSGPAAGFLVHAADITVALKTIATTELVSYDKSMTETSETTFEQKIKLLKKCIEDIEVTASEFADALDESDRTRQHRALDDLTAIVDLMNRTW